MKKATIVSRPGWNAVSAVRDDRIFEIKSTYILQPGPASLTDGVRQIHEICGDQHKGHKGHRDHNDSAGRTPRGRSLLPVRLCALCALCVVP
jgi:hypothetical protein